MNDERASEEEEEEYLKGFFIPVSLPFRVHRSAFIVYHYA